jgi:putative lipoic acid-binding regulatory protein
VTEILIDAMDTASKLRNRDAGGKVTTVLGDLGQSTLGGNLTWQELDERVNEYPSDRKFQAIGEGGEAFVAKIVGLVEEALGRKVDPANVTSRPSSKGKYVSANVTARLENGDEVVAVFSKLKECEDVKWYL